MGTLIGSYRLLSRVRDINEHGLTLTAIMLYVLLGYASVLYASLYTG